MVKRSRQLIYLCAGWLSLGLGIIGIPLPLLPTTPFLLLAAFCFARGSERWHQWLITHPSFGPPILNWQEHRAISRGAKRVGTLSMGGLLLLSGLLGVPPWALAAQAAVLVAVGIFLWSHAEPPEPE